MNQEQLTSRLLNQSKDLIWIVDLEFQLVYANEAYQNFMKDATGATKEIGDIAFIKDFGKDDVEKWRDYYTRAMNGELFKIEEHFYHPETMEKEYNQTSFKPVYDDHKSICAVACESRGIAQSVKKRYESNELIDASLDVFCSIDEYGKFVHVSAASKYHWGYSPDELVGKSYIDLILEEDVSKTNAIAADIMAGQNIRTFVNRYKKKGGGIAYNSWSARWDSKVRLMYCVARDTQEKIEQEEILFQSEQRFKALVQEGADLIGILDEEGTYKYVSPSSTGVLGISPEEFVGRNTFEFIHPEDAGRVKDCIQQLESAGKVKVAPFRFQNDKKEWIWIETVLTNMLDNPAVNGIVSNSRDITEEKKLRKLNKQTNELAKIGSWEFDLLSDQLYWSDQVHHLHETNPDTFVPELNKAIDFYKKGYQNLVRDSIEKSVTRGVVVDFEAIIVTANKKERWVRVLGNSEFRDGKCIKFFGSTQDISERKEAEVRLLSLADNLPGVVFQYFIYPDGTDELKYVTKGAKRVWGFPADDVIDNNQLVWDQIEAGGELEEVQSSIQDAIETKTKWTARWKYVMTNGEIKTHLGLGSPNFLADGTVLFNSVILDITKEVKNEELLKEVSQVAKIGSWEVDLQYEENYKSEMVNEILELDAHLVIDDLDSALSYCREDFRPMVKDKFMDCVQKGISFDYEAVIVTANNMEKWVRIIGKPKVNDRKCIKVLGSIQDIQESKSLELQIREILRSISDPFHVIDANWKFKYFNEEAEELLQKTKEEVIGKVIWDVFPEKIGTQLESVYKTVAQTNEPSSIEYLFPSNNRWYEVNVYPFQGGISAYFRNINARKLAAEKLKELNASLKTYSLELERSNEELEQFAFVTSHDMQEPLRMISSFMDQLKRKYGDQLDEKALQYIHFATDGAKRMQQIILDLLDYSRANRPTEEVEEIDLNIVVSEFKELRRNLISENAVTLVTHDLPSLKTYRALITQIFHCLLDNAIKYSKPDNETVVEVKVAEKESEWEFSISDNGIGIDPKFFDKIFIIFQRLHNRDQYKGTGIGLSIVKRSVEFLGGEIWLESTEGKGTTFFFTFSKNKLKE